ncbi:uncharacterized protein KY384_005360 [Bacidia gigantensis]|uniref:uncharacterized protein n=1 Tax=Bacidia gigantensis TaxID=2732470 RepID=UPI001D04DEB9|nr:uncharacterized protein KY384_005360 [Bacidia gigantensis]KAG8529879.1 hypothetical protein KY384_005360 [Bacidia gigantensis]
MSLPPNAGASAGNHRHVSFVQEPNTPVNGSPDITIPNATPNINSFKAAANIEKIQRDPAKSKVMFTPDKTAKEADSQSPSPPNGQKLTHATIAKRRLSDASDGSHASVLTTSGSSSYVQSRENSVTSSTGTPMDGVEDTYENGERRKPAKKRAKFNDNCMGPPMLPRRRRAPDPVAVNLLRRTGPQFQGAQHLTSHFASTCYEIYLGNDFSSSGHEMMLAKSPTFVEHMNRARSNARQKQVLRLDNYNQEPFDQMFNYLYTDRLDTLPANDGNRYARLEELRLLMRLANTFQLPDLQCQIVDHVRKHRLVGKIGMHTFFDWAYEIYTNEFDHTVGNFSKFFQDVAPGFLQKKIDNEKSPNGKPAMIHLFNLVAAGGGFAVEVLKASHTYTDSHTNLKAMNSSLIKQEPRASPKKKLTVKKEPGSTDTMARLPVPAATMARPPAPPASAATMARPTVAAATMAEPPFSAHSFDGAISLSSDDE